MSKVITAAAPGTKVIQINVDHLAKKTTLKSASVLNFEHNDEAPYVRPITLHGPITPYRDGDNRESTIALKHPDGTVETFYGRTFATEADFRAHVQMLLPDHHTVVDKTKPESFDKVTVEELNEENRRELSRRHLI